MTFAPKQKIDMDLYAKIFAFLNIFLENTDKAENPDIEISVRTSEIFSFESLKMLIRYQMAILGWNMEDVEVNIEVIPDVAGASRTLYVILVHLGDFDEDRVCISQENLDYIHHMFETRIHEMTPDDNEVFAVVDHIFSNEVPEMVVDYFSQLFETFGWHQVGVKEKPLSIVVYRN